MIRFVPNAIVGGVVSLVIGSGTGAFAGAHVGAVSAHKGHLESWTTSATGPAPFVPAKTGSRITDCYTSPVGSGAKKECSASRNVTLIHRFERDLNSLSKAKYGATVCPKDTGSFARLTVAKAGRVEFTLRIEMSGCKEAIRVATKSARLTTRGLRKEIKDLALGSTS